MKRSGYRQMTRCSTSTHNGASQPAAVSVGVGLCQDALQAICLDRKWLTSARSLFRRNVLWQRFELAVAFISVPDVLLHAVCLPGWKRWGRAQQTLNSLASSRRRHFRKWKALPELDTAIGHFSSAAKCVVWRAAGN